MAPISNWFIRIAAAWFVVGVTLGIVMGASHDHSMFPVHAHINLLGWVCMALFAGFYKLWPQAAASKLAKVHFWVYVPGHFVMMLALAALFKGMTSIEPILAIASMVVGAGVLVFAVLVFKVTGQPVELTAAEAKLA